jgi:hypothetical protein
MFIDLWNRLLRNAAIYVPIIAKQKEDSDEFFFIKKKTGVREADLSVNSLTGQALCAQDQISFVEIDPGIREVKIEKLSNKFRKDKGTLHA